MHHQLHVQKQAASPLPLCIDNVDGGSVASWKMLYIYPCQNLPHVEEQSIVSEVI